MNEVATITPQPSDTTVSPSDTNSPMGMIAHAVQQGASVETLEKLMALQERHEKNHARRAFDMAIAKAKASIGPIVKRQEVDFTGAKGRTNYKYESLADIDAQVDPILASHGLSCRYRSNDDGSNVTVTCVIAHELGHFEETSLSGPADMSGNKNPYQGKGSAVTYLQRYTKKIALGLSATVDDDAQGASVVETPRVKTVTPEQYIQLRDKAEEAGVDEQTICDAYGGSSLQQFPFASFDSAMKKLAKTIEAKKPPLIGEDEIPY